MHRFEWLTNHNTLQWNERVKKEQNLLGSSEMYFISLMRVTCAKFLPAVHESSVYLCAHNYFVLQLLCSGRSYSLVLIGRFIYMYICIDLLLSWKLSTRYRPSPQTVRMSITHPERMLDEHFLFSNMGGKETLKGFIILKEKCIKNFPHFLSHMSYWFGNNQLIK